MARVGSGHKIAFNVLNFGRFKLGASVVAGVRYVTNEAIHYAKGRQQFGKPIIEFGAIQHKLAEMAIQIFCAESMVYRTVGMIDTAMRSIDKASRTAAAETLKALEDYVVECSIIKVANSEILDFVVDEAVQIYGGYGYSQDYPVERSYRDARINRIFEGTNEINRLLITGQLLKRAMKGQLGLITAAQKLLGELLSFPAMEAEDDGLLAAEQRLVSNAKKMFLLASGVAVQKYRDKMADQQEVLGLLSDLVIGVYAMESLLLRVLKGAARDGVGRWDATGQGNPSVRSQPGCDARRQSETDSGCCIGRRRAAHASRRVAAFRKINASEFDQLEAGHRSKAQRGREVLLELRT